MIVLDCCAAVEIARETDEGRALQSLMLTDEKIISSELLYIELASTFRKYVKAGIMDHSQALARMGIALGLVNNFVPLQENYIEAFHQAIVSDHSVYDFLYLTLARRNSATLVSVDKRLNSLCDELGVDRLHEIDWIGLEAEDEN